MFIRSRTRLLWVFLLRFAALIALSIAVLAGISLANDGGTKAQQERFPEPEQRVDTALA